MNPQPNPHPQVNAERAAASRPTLAHVARLAGVAPSTVSAVLGRRPYCYASQKTRDRVWAAARKLDFHPNPLARGLRGGATQKIGVVLDGLSAFGVTASKIGSIEAELWSKGYRLILGMHRDDPAREEQYIRWCLSEAVDGLILSPTNHGVPELIQSLLQSSTPLVTLETTLPFPTPHVGVDRERGGYLQVRHLLDIGRRRLAFLLTGTKMQPGNRKLVGIRRALAETGMDPDPALMLSDTRQMDEAAASYGEAMARELLSRNKPFDALLTTSDTIAMAAMPVLLKAGLRIPEDVAVIGFDDDVFAPYLPVPLTTIHQPREELGIKAVQLLLRRIDDKKNAASNDTDFEQVLVQPELIVRQST